MATDLSVPNDTLALRTPLQMSDVRVVLTCMPKRQNTGYCDMSAAEVSKYQLGCLPSLPT